MATKIAVTVGGTYNIGNFEFIRMDVMIEDSCLKEEAFKDEEATAKQLKDKASAILKKLVAEEEADRRY